MRAVVFAAAGEPTVADRPEPVPGPREVVIETAAAGICGTGTHVLDGEFEGTVFPLVPGHEATGTVAALGPGADEAPSTPAAGDHVAVNPSSTCGQCDLCLTGRQNLCRAWNGMGVVRAHGAAQQRFTAPAANVFTLRPDTGVFEAALIEPLACAIHGRDVLPRRMAGHVLVYGAGTMGLLMAQLAPRAGAAPVTIIDVNPDRLVTAAEAGTEHRYTNTADADRAERDVVIDCTGSTAAIQDGLPRVIAGGVFQHFGVTPADATARYSPFRVYRDEVSVAGTMAVLNSFRRAAAMSETGAIKAQPMISHSVTLENYAQALRMFRAGQGRKLQVRPNQHTSQAPPGQHRQTNPPPPP
jgi:2-desacetyl-2-hydroxyethyl bacteriochlorophyllide A dehydrogenase